MGVDVELGVVSSKVGRLVGVSADAGCQGVGLVSGMGGPKMGCWGFACFSFGIDVEEGKFAGFRVASGTSIILSPG